MIVVILGTNHRAVWLDGLAAWERGSWDTPLGDVVVDEALAAAIVSLGPPFAVDREAHLEEHSIEVQLPLLREVAGSARIVPLACSPGVGDQAIEAGARLGALLAGRGSADRPIVLAISTDMAHYPAARDAEAVTAELLPFIVSLDPEGLADREQDLRDLSMLGRGPRGLACGMCGIEPAVVGLAALRAMGASRGTALAAATSADVGGPADRTVGYVAARFD
jgi:AmmeMemoRadiSam system protein B